MNTTPGLHHQRRSIAGLPRQREDGAGLHRREVGEGEAGVNLHKRAGEAAGVLLPGEGEHEEGIRPGNHAGVPRGRAAGVTRGRGGELPPLRTGGALQEERGVVGRDTDRVEVTSK